MKFFGRDELVLLERFNLLMINFCINWFFLYVYYIVNIDYIDWFFIEMEGSK